MSYQVVICRPAGLSRPLGSPGAGVGVSDLGRREGWNPAAAIPLGSPDPTPPEER